jgi:flagellar basal-body rod protein FlgC
MNPLDATLKQAASGMQLQSRRLEVSAENLSNADTPGYRRKLLLADAPISGADAFQATRIALDPSAAETRYEPNHPMADEQGYLTLSNVSVITEMADMREANRTFEANLNAFRHAREMYASLISLLRR